VRSTWATIDGIAAILKEAQLNDGTVPFPLDDDLQIYEFQPPDFRFDGKEMEQGMYIYFEDTRFERSDGGNQDVSHNPNISIDFVVSKGAELDTETDTFKFSNLVAEATLRTITSQVFDAMTDTRFLRLLNAKIAANISVTDEFNCSELWFAKADKLGTLRFVKSSKTISIFRFVVQTNIAEVHGNNPGIAYDGTKDHITPYLKGQEFEE